MLSFQGDGKVAEDLNEARPNGFALDFRIFLALQSTRLLLHPTKQQGMAALGELRQRRL